MSKYPNERDAKMSTRVDVQDNADWDKWNDEMTKNVRTNFAAALRRSVKFGSKRRTN